MNQLQWVTNELHKRRGDWKQVAEESGVPYFTIAKISQGVTKNPRWQTIDALSTALKNGGIDAPETKPLGKQRAAA